MGISRFPRASNDSIQWFQADISDTEQLGRIFREMKSRAGRIEGLIHLAAHIDLLDRPSEKWELVNVGGTENLLREAIQHEISFFVYSSSIVVMDSPQKIAFLDEAAKRKARGFYATSKLRGEQVVESYQDKIKVATLRIGSVYWEKPHLSYLNYQIASFYNGDFSTRFLPAPLSGGMAYVHLQDVGNSFQKLLKKIESIPSGEIFVISEEGYLPHMVLFRKIQCALEEVPPAIFPIPISWAKWGTLIVHAWDRLGHPHLHYRPWMAEFATLPFCVDTRKAKKDLEWTCRHHITVHLEQSIRDLKERPEEWFKERNLRLKKKWFRNSKKKILRFWDWFLCPWILDVFKIIRAYLPWKVATLVRQEDAKEHYWRSTKEIKAPEAEAIFNLHRLELPCRIPWQYLLSVVVVSWPTSLVHFVQTQEGYDYRFLSRWELLHFKKEQEVPGAFLRYKVTSGFAAGGSQVFLVTQDGQTGKHYVYIDTRVPRGQLFPVRIHNFYTAEHLRNIRKNLFSFQLEQGESLL